MDLGFEPNSMSLWAQPSSPYCAEYIWRMSNCPLGRSTKWLSKKMNSNYQKRTRAILCDGARIWTQICLTPEAGSNQLYYTAWWKGYYRMQVWVLQQRLEQAWTKQARSLFLLHHSPGLCGGSMVVDTRLLSSQRTATLKTQLPSCGVSCSNTTDQVCIPALGKREGEGESSLLPFEGTIWNLFPLFHLTWLWSALSHMAVPSCKGGWAYSGNCLKFYSFIRWQEWIIAYT